MAIGTLLPHALTRGLIPLEGATIPERTGRSARVAPTRSALALTRRLLLCCLLAVLPAWTGHAGDEPPVPPGQTPARIEKPAHPFVAPSGPSRAAWELYLKNDIPAAERAFREVLTKTPRDLEALEGLRVCLLADGRFAGVQEVNLRMIAAAAATPLCGAFADRALDTLALTDSRTALAECLERTAAEAPAPSRDALLEVLTSLCLREEQPEKARALAPRLGYVTRWLFVAGPFGAHDPNNPLERRFAPERPLGKLEFQDERGQAVVVQRDLAVPCRVLDLSRRFAEARGIFYALTNLESDAEREVLLVLAVPLDSHVYLRGLPVYRPSLETQKPRIPPLLKVRLLKGPNPLLVKFPGPDSLSVRCLATDYAAAAGVSVQDLPAETLARHEVLALRGVLFSTEASGLLAHHFLSGASGHTPSPALPVNGEGAHPLPALPVNGEGAHPPPAKQGAEPDLLGLAQTGGLNLAQALWLERAMRAERDSAAREAWAGVLAGSFPDSVGALDYAAAVLADSSREGRNADSRLLEEARQLRERALGIGSQSHAHLLALYEFFSERGLKDQALEKLKACVAAHPDSALAHSKLAREYVERHLNPLGQQEFEQAARLESVYRPALANFLETHGDAARARKLEAQLLKDGLRSPMADYPRLRQEGKYAAAEELLVAQEKAYPDRADEFREMRADLYRDAGEVRKALDLRRELAGEKPRRADAVFDYADLALRQDRADEARQALTALRKEHPGNVQARQLLRELSGRGGERWWEPYDVKVEELDTSAFTAAKYPRANYAWIVDFMVTRVLPDLSTESYVHIAQKVLNQNGIDELSELLVRAKQRDMIFVRTRNADGQTYMPENVHRFNLAQSASFMRVGPGSILEHAYLMHEEADERDPQMHMAFNFNALDAPRAVSRWVVIVPEEAKLDIRRIRPELLDEKILPGPPGQTVYQWTNKRVEGIPVEPLMPAEREEEVIPLVFVESPERTYCATRLVTGRERYSLPPKAEALAQRLAKESGGREEKTFRAILAWVRANIQAGRETRSLEDVWLLRSGHPGQMTDLTVALSRAAGLRVDSALVNAAYLPGRKWVTKYARRVWDPADFAAFGSGRRMIVFEPETGASQWVQFAGQKATYFSPDDLLDGQARALALTYGEEGVRVRRVRAESLQQGYMRHAPAVALDERGSGRVRGRVQVFGLLGGQLREAFADPRRAETIQQGLLQHFWKAIADPQLTVRGLETAEQPVVLEYGGQLRDLAARADGSFFLLPFPARADILQFMGPAERMHDLLIHAEIGDDLDYRVTYTAPRGYGWAEAPDGLFLCTEFGFYLASFSVRGETLTCTRSFLLPAQRVTPEKYPAFMRFLRRIAETEAQRAAYRKLDFPGVGALARPVLSLGYASHGGEAEERAARKAAGNEDPPK